MAETREYTTVLGPDSRLKGELSFDSAAKIAGSIEGTISSKGKLLIAGGAACKAAVQAGEVEVEGHIQGNVEASERIEIKANGKITGDIIASRMMMADGAAIDGHVRIGLEGKDNGKASATAEPKLTAPQTAKAK